MATKTPVTINGIEFDALIDSSETFESSVPEYPVEKGYSVSDGVILKPPRLDMTLFVTNTPVTWLSRHPASDSRTKEVVDKLKALYFKSEPVTIVTSEEIYEDYCIESLTISKSVESGSSREIPISFKKIAVTQATTTTIPSSYGKSGTTAAPAGTASTTTTSGGGGSTGSGVTTSTKGSGGKGSILYSVGKSIGLV